MIYVRGKGAKERKVPLGSVAQQHLNTHVQCWRGETTSGDEHVFLNAYGNPMIREAGIRDKRVSAHTCCHWFEVNCIKNGMPAIVLQGLLGHESLEMVNTYVRLAEQDNRVLYTTYSPVDRLAMHHSAKDKRENGCFEDGFNSTIGFFGSRVHFVSCVTIGLRIGSFGLWSGFLTSDLSC